MSTLLLDTLVPGHIQNFEPYYPSKPDRVLKKTYGLKHLHRLNNNENHLGPPPLVRQVIAQFPPEAAPIYPNGDCHDLRQVLAERYHKTTPDQFLVGNGSCEVITSVIKAFCIAGDNIITADKTFAVYEWVAQFSGVEARLIPLKGYTFDPAAMLAAMDHRTKIMFVCNPNNPTGTYWDQDTMTGFLEAVNNRCVVVIDEAYCEYVDAPDFPDAMALMERFSNVISFRTFSKMYALAAFRIGYLCSSPQIVDMVRRTHIVYSVNTMAQKAARAALTDDRQFLVDTRIMVAEAKNTLCPILNELGLTYLCNQGNFMMVKTPMSDTLLYRMLMQQGFMVRTMTGFRFPNWIRISLAPRPVMAAFSIVLKSIISTYLEEE
jgi:histidinol-phosphate aminotransferase